MANVLFTRTSDPNSKPVTDGQLIFDTSGNGKMYLDNGTDRLEMGGAVTVDATLSKTSTNPVQNKAVAGVMLDTLSDIGNVTSKGFLTDALAVKQLNTNVNELNNSFQASLEYSTDEQIIGTWIDGSPIYRKVFTGTFTQTSTDVVIGNIPSSRVVNIYGSVKNSSNEYLPLNFIVQISNLFYYIHTLARSNGDVCIWSDWAGPYNCIVEYIK